MSYEDIRNTLNNSERARQTEFIGIENEIYHYKRKYCVDCKFLNRRDYSCNKKRVVRICVKKYLKNKE